MVVAFTSPCSKNHYSYVKFKWVNGVVHEFYLNKSVKGVEQHGTLRTGKLEMQIFISLPKKSPWPRRWLRRMRLGQLPARRCAGSAGGDLGLETPGSGICRAALSQQDAHRARTLLSHTGTEPGDPDPRRGAVRS